MFQLMYVLLFILEQYGRYCVEIQGWNYINLHCRDNDNKPVEWWFVYKPPSDVIPGYYSGRNFSYITSETDGRWQPSNVFITSDSMLQLTLSPLFRPTYTEYLATLVYQEHVGGEQFQGSSSRGILMADELGGVLLVHTLPDFPNMQKVRSVFPEDQLEYGHLFVCLSLDLRTLDKVAVAIKSTMPKVKLVQMPSRLESILPNWKKLNEPTQSTQIRKPLPAMEFLTIQNTLRGIILGRRPGDNRCLYKRFAMLQKIVLDVYGNDKHRKPICAKDFSVRNINSISLKYPDQVYYINNASDHARFAVSAAAHWQRSGASAAQYWTCTNTLENRDDTAKGGFVLCLEHYGIWWSFDNLKVNEPVC